MVQTDIVHPSRGVRQEREVAGHMVPQSGSREMTVSAQITFSSFPFLFSSPGP